MQKTDKPPTWKQILRKFNSKERIDTFCVDDSYEFRGSLPKSQTTLQNILKTKPCKTFNDFAHINLPCPWDSDYLKGFTKTNVQQFVDIMCPMMKWFGTLALSCPCGSGKTLAGISMIAKLGLQTLIISTRCAINDQWRDTLLKVFKDNIIVQTNDGCFTYSNNNKVVRLNKNHLPRQVDVFIYSPQYFVYHSRIDEKFPTSVGLVIYDEIHSQLSSIYGQALLQPFVNVIKNKTSELPCLLGLSATYPPSGEYYNMLNKIFGTILTNKSTITNIPIQFYDIRDDYHRDNKHDILDQRYSPVDDYEFITNVLTNQYSFFNDNIEPTILNEPKLAGFVITSSIKSSVYAWICFQKKYPTKRCVLVRDNVNGCYEFISDIPQELIKLGPLIELGNITNHPLYNTFCKHSSNYTDGQILIGTYQRLKEGISVENAVWCVCSRFLWSIATRVQLLGRIRRMSNNDYINKYPRYFLTCSSKIPTNQGNIINWKRTHRGKNPGKLKIDYDIDTEDMMFKLENYVRVSPMNTQHVAKKSANTYGDYFQ